MVENHEGNHALLLDNVDAKQAVYIYGCKNCTVQVCSPGSSVLSAHSMQPELALTGAASKHSLWCRCKAR